MFSLKPTVTGPAFARASGNRHAEVSHCISASAPLRRGALQHASNLLPVPHAQLQAGHRTPYGGSLLAWPAVDTVDRTSLQEQFSLSLTEGAAAVWRKRQHASTQADTICLLFPGQQSVATPAKVVGVSGQLPRTLNLTAWCGIPAHIAQPVEAPQRPGQAARLAHLLQRQSFAQECYKDLLAALLHASAHVADVITTAVSAMKKFPPLMLGSKSAPLPLQSVPGSQATAATEEGHLLATPKASTSPLALCYPASSGKPVKLPTHVRTKSAPSAMHVERSDSAQEFIQTLYLAEDFLTDDNSGSPKIQALRIRDDKPVLSAFTDDGRSQKAGAQISSACTTQNAMEHMSSVSLLTQLEFAQATIKEQNRQLGAQSAIIQGQTQSITEGKAARSKLQEELQATREQKARLETAVISAGRQLKLVTAQRNNLTQMMSKKVADETAKNLESVYGPLLEAYKAKCARLEEQVQSAQPALPSPAQSVGDPSPQPVPQQQNQVLQGLPPGALNLPSAQAQQTAAAAPAAQQSYPQLPDSLGDFRYWTKYAAPAPVLFG